MSIIYVNRSVPPWFPDWVEKVLFPDLQSAGPAEYGIDQVEQWLHPDQISGITTGNVIFQHLKDADAIKDQLGLADLLVIQDKGIVFFRKYFAREAVFAWKSIIQDRNGDLYVPCLIENGGKVILLWYWLDNYFHSNRPALRFAGGI